MARSRHETGELLRFPNPVSGPAGGPGPDSDSDSARPAIDGARRDDVDTWGRSEHFRQLARKAGSFYYDRWFRVEWEGLEKIPRTGGALLIANHAGAIPADAPMIMQGIETELGRPVYGLADYWFRTLPVIGTLWSRGGGVPADPDNAYRLLHDDGQLVLVFPEGTKGPGKLSREQVPAPSLRPGWLRRDGDASRCARRPHRRGRRRGVHADPVQGPGSRAGTWRPLRPRDRQPPSARADAGDVAPLPGQVPLPRARPHRFRRRTRSRALPEEQGHGASRHDPPRPPGRAYEMLANRASVWFG